MSEKIYDSPSGPGLDLEDFHPAVGEDVEISYSPAQQRSAKYVGKKGAKDGRYPKKQGVVDY